MNNSSRFSISGFVKLPNLAAIGTLLFAGPSGLALETADVAPRNVQFIEKRADQLSDNTPPSAEGRLALSIKPEKWKHAETDHFIIHYRRVTEAQKVVHEIEYHLWFVAKALGATKERYARKSHVFIFEDEEEWKEFLSKTSNPQWSGSFAHGDELFLSVRHSAGQFDDQTLAHETTHAVVARLYPGARWPVWLSEGFAEYMGGASVGARKGITAKHFQRNLSYGDLPVEQLTAMTSYPTDREAVHALYQSSERLIRFLMNEWPKEQFPLFVTQIMIGNDFQAAFKTVYGDKTKGFDAFARKYDRFVR